MEVHEFVESLQARCCHYNAARAYTYDDFFFLASSQVLEMFFFVSLFIVSV